MKKFKADLEVRNLFIKRLIRELRRLVVLDMSFIGRQRIDMSKVVIFLLKKHIIGLVLQLWLL